MARSETSEPWYERDIVKVAARLEDLEALDVDPDDLRAMVVYLYNRGKVTRDKAAEFREGFAEMIRKPEK